MGWAIAYFAFGRYALPVGLFWLGFVEITPMIGSSLGSVPAVVIGLFTGGFAQVFLVSALFLVAQRPKGDRVAAAALRYLCEPLLFERWHMATVSKLALEEEQALVEPTAPGERPAGLRGFVGRGV